MINLCRPHNTPDLACEGGCGQAGMTLVISLWKVLRYQAINLNSSTIIQALWLHMQALFHLRDSVKLHCKLIITSGCQPSSTAESITTAGLVHRGLRAEGAYTTIP